MSVIDLHIHSIYSDGGKLTPKEIIDKCIEKNIKIIAITDKNNVLGVKEAINYGEENDIIVIPGIEIDCLYEKTHIQLLGYFIDYENKKLQELKEIQLEQKEKAIKKIIKKLEKIGFYINHEKLNTIFNNEGVCLEIIAKAIIHEKENENNPLLEQYLNLTNPYLSFYTDFLTEGKPAYVSIKYISLTKALKLIRDAEGVSVLANPTLSIGFDEEKLTNILEKGIEGIEVFTSNHNQEQINFYLDKANQHNIIITCGSNYYNDNNSNITIGDCNLNIINEQELVRAIKVLDQISDAL